MDTKTLVVGQKVRVKRLLAAIANCFKANVYFKEEEGDPYLRAVREEWKAEKVGEVMDTKTLVVGQEVFVVSGRYYSKGKLVKVTQESVEVQLTRNPLPGPNTVIWQFDTKGKARDGVGTAEYGPYMIDDMPFEERKAELVAAKLRREFLHKKYPDGSVLPANEPLLPIFDADILSTD